MNLLKLFKINELDHANPEYVREFVHSMSDFHIYEPINGSYHPIIPYEIGDEDGTIVLKGEITSYSDYKNVIDKLIDLKRWEQIDPMVITYKSIMVDQLWYMHKKTTDSGKKSVVIDSVNNHLENSQS